MRLAELRSRWSARRAELCRLHAFVDGAAIVDELLQDLAALEHAATIEHVTLREASTIGGYSVDHLQGLVASGTIENVGRKHRPRIRRCDVPMKPGHQLQESSDAVSSDRRRIVASVTTTGNEGKS